MSARDGEPLDKGLRAVMIDEAWAIVETLAEMWFAGGLSGTSEHVQQIGVWAHQLVDRRAAVLGR